MHKPHKIIFTPELIAEIGRLAEKSLSLEEIACSLGFSVTTLKRRKKDMDQVDQCIKRGRTKAKSFVTNRLFQKIKEGDTTSIIFYLKCHGWHDIERHEVKLSGDVQETVIYQYEWAEKAGVKPEKKDKSHDSKDASDASKDSQKDSPQGTDDHDENNVK